MPTTLYDKVLEVVKRLRNSIDQKAGKIDIAPLFDESVGYPVDSLVFYENVLYRCTTAHQGPWNIGDFATATIQDILAMKAKKSDLAPEFNEETIYSKYQLVFKDGEFSQCTTPGVGSNAVFQRITVADLIARIEQEITQGVALDAIYKAVQNIAPAYEIRNNYKAKDICTYKGVLYECVEDVKAENSDPDEAWWNRYWKRTTVDTVLKSQYIQNGGNATLNTLVFRDEYTKLEFSAYSIKSTRLTDDGQEGPDKRIFLDVRKSGTVSLLLDLAPDYEVLTNDGEVKFEAGMMVTQGNGLYICTVAHTSQTWISDNWTECTIDAVIDGLMDALSKVHADVVSLEDDVASLGGQVLVGKNGTGVGVSTTGLLPDYGGMDFVRRIFFVPSQMSVPDIVGLSVLNGKLELDNGEYRCVWFKPAFFGLKQGDYITSVSFVTRSGTASGGTAYARLWRTWANGSRRDPSTLSTGTANWSAQAESVIEYEFENFQVEDPDLYLCIDFTEENTLQAHKYVKVGMRLLKQAGYGQRYLFINDKTNPFDANSNILPYNMTVSGNSSNKKSIRFENNKYYLHICECEEGFTTTDIGPNVSGKVVAVMATDDTWPSYYSAISCRYVLNDAVTLNPDRMHFIAFDTYQQAKGATFSDGEFLPIGLVRGENNQYTCPYNNFVLRTDDNACPRVSFISAITPYRRKMKYYYDSADFSNAPFILLPSTASGEVEVRILVYGCGESNTLSVFAEAASFTLLGDSSWLSNNNGLYGINIEAYTTIMLIFKSIATVLRPLPGQSVLAPMEFWSVERQVLI